MTGFPFDESTFTEDDVKNFFKENTYKQKKGKEKFVEVDDVIRLYSLEKFSGFQDELKEKNRQKDIMEFYTDPANEFDKNHKAAIATSCGGLKKV